VCFLCPITDELADLFLRTDSLGGGSPWEGALLPHLHKGLPAAKSREVFKAGISGVDIHCMASRPIVLLVDDDPNMRELLQTIFTLDGRFRIGGCAVDGFEGAMLCADVQPQVVVLDYFMPRWDGEKVALFMRQHSPETKIIAFSAVIDEAPAWADAFLVKNDIGNLVPLVDKLLAQSAA